MGYQHATTSGADAFEQSAQFAQHQGCGRMALGKAQRQLAHPLRQAGFAPLRLVIECAANVGIQASQFRLELIVQRYAGFQGGAQPVETLFDGLLIHESSSGLCDVANLRPRERLPADLHETPGQAAQPNPDAMAGVPCCVPNGILSTNPEPSMNLHTWLLYALTVGVISAIPGPNMLLVMSHGARHGLRRSTATMAGCMSALLIMMSISAAGLGVFLQAWPALFDALRLLGATYLVYLGIKTWRAAAHAETLASPPTDAKELPRTLHTPGALYRNGFLVASSNPKAILFAAALLPQFMSPTAHGPLQFVVLVITFAAIEVSWYCIYASFGSRLGQVLRGAPVARAFQRATGGIFIGFGAAMAALHR